MVWTHSGGRKVVGPWDDSFVVRHTPWLRVMGSGGAILVATDQIAS